jgi:hypothetical protein
MSNTKKAVIIGVDPHKMSVTIEVVDTHEQLLGSGRFDTTNAGYADMRRYVKQWPDRVWAVEEPTVPAVRWLSDSSPPVTAWSMCRPSWRPGCGSSTPATTARPTP